LSGHIRWARRRESDVPLPDSSKPVEAILRAFLEGVAHNLPGCRQKRALQDGGQDSGERSGMRRLLLLFLLLACCSTSPSGAQSFSPVGSMVFVELRDRYGNSRFTLATYATQWPNSTPWTIRLTTFNFETLEIASATFNSFSDNRPVSPLMEAVYVLSPRWSVGFWYNPIRGERLHRQVQPPNFDQPVDLNLQRNTDLADLHLIYHGPHGLTGQLGYFRENGTISDRRSQPVPPLDFVLNSWNLWLTQRLDVRWRGRLITPFLSAGYHTSSDLRRAASLQTGLAVTFNKRTRLSASVWFFDLSNREPGTAIRFTTGLVYRFDAPSAR
jgi:hypothetical protein